MKINVNRYEALRLIIERATSLISAPHDKEGCQKLLAGIFECGFAYGVETDALYGAKSHIYIDEKSGLICARLTRDALRTFRANLKMDDLQND